MKTPRLGWRALGLLATTLAPLTLAAARVDPAVADEWARAASQTAANAPAPGGGQMGLLVFVFVLAIFLGFELIAKVPSQLHTPLMSGSNAISGITIVGALLAAGHGEAGLMTVLGTLAVTFAMINVVGGYLVTDRMLAMFKSRKGADQ